MRTISQRELRNNSGAVLRAVAAGESLVITNHGQPAALLSPVPATTRDRLVAAGRLVPALRGFGAAPRPPRAAAEAGTDALVELDRSDQR
jgi:prevent-host-death family protein